MEKYEFEPQTAINRFADTDIVTTSGLLDEDELLPWALR